MTDIRNLDCFDYVEDTNSVDEKFYETNQSKYSKYFCIFFFFLIYDTCHELATKIDIHLLILVHPLE